MTSIRNNLILLLVLTSCVQERRFESPQPEGRRDERSLPTRLTGHYENVKDSSKLFIGEGIVVKKAFFDMKTHRSGLDSADQVKFRNDTTFSGEEFGERINVSFRNDTLYYHATHHDTLFDSRRGDILRKFKGHYFLNVGGGNRWDVTKLTPVRDGLIVSTLSVKEDIIHLRELTGAADTTHTFRPTKKQFRRFLKEEGFSDEEAYMKVY